MFSILTGGCKSNVAPVSAFSDFLVLFSPFAFFPRRSDAGWNPAVIAVLKRAAAFSGVAWTHSEAIQFLSCKSGAACMFLESPELWSWDEEGQGTGVIAVVHRDC